MAINLGGVVSAYKEVHPGNEIFCHQEYLAILFRTLALAKDFVESLTKTEDDYDKNYPASYFPKAVKLPNGMIAVIMQSREMQEDLNQHAQVLERRLNMKKVIQPLPEGSNVLEKLIHVAQNTIPDEEGLQGDVGYVHLSKMERELLDRLQSNITEIDKAHGVTALRS